MHKIEPSDAPPPDAPAPPTAPLATPPWRTAALLVLAAHAGVAAVIASARPAELTLESAPIQFDLVRAEPLPMAPPPVEEPPPPPPPPPPPEPPPPEPEPEALVAAPAPVPVPEPPAPPPRPKPVRKPPPKKVEAPVPPAPEPPPPAPAAPEVPAPPAPVPVAPIAAAPAPEPLVQARFDAAYLKNPAPGYPSISRRLGEQGTTQMRVCLDAQGSPQSVDVSRSSGFERLDTAAVQAVRKWRFEPARRGSTPVADCVVVPVNFRLDS